MIQRGGDGEDVAFVKDDKKKRCKSNDETANGAGKMIFEQS
jgi:hypothetical protein